MDGKSEVKEKKIELPCAECTKILPGASVSDKDGPMTDPSLPWSGLCETHATTLDEEIQEIRQRARREETALIARRVPAAVFNEVASHRGCRIEIRAERKIHDVVKWPVMLFFSAAVIFAEEHKHCFPIEAGFFVDMVNVPGGLMCSTLEREMGVDIFSNIKYGNIAHPPYGPANPVDILDSMRRYAHEVIDMVIATGGKKENKEAHFRDLSVLIRASSTPPGPVSASFSFPKSSSESPLPKLRAAPPPTPPTPPTLPTSPTPPTPAKARPKRPAPSKTASLSKTAGLSKPTGPPKPMQPVKPAGWPSSVPLSWAARVGRLT